MGLKFLVVRRNILFLFLMLAVLLTTTLVGCDKKQSDVSIKQTNETASTQKTATVLGTSPQFVGRQVCGECHQQQLHLWQDSHHDLAMQEANPKTVLGDFNNQTFTLAGVTSTFFKRDGKYFVNTDNAEGKLQEFEITYTFGVTPLQQYLIDFPDGRKQALGIAWDTRPAEQGGQRWFHVYPENPPKSGDVLHWTGIDQTWNYQCAECHSTNLKKNYNPENNSYNTNWSEIDVSCEACHGPGSNHAAWAKQPDQRPGIINKGLVADLSERQDITWTIDSTTGNAKRSEPNTNRSEVEICGRCHARRGVISEDYQYGELLNTHRTALLTEGLYHPDGQIQDEVYVYGSFRQSKMYQHSVTCSDCHEPHSLELRAEGNGVCLQCHAAQRFDDPKHHFHTRGTAGASCVACHMPPKTYMVVDPRHDHSMRVPRPDLSVELGVPNACNNCHSKKSSEWAAKRVRKWYGHVPKGLQDYGKTFSTARRGNPASAKDLQQIAKDGTASTMARATAIAELGPFLSAHSVTTVVDALYDEDAMVRRAAILALANTESGVRIKLIFPLLDDPVLAVRLEAARVLASIPMPQLDANQQQRLSTVLDEYKQSLAVNADRPESQVELGVLLINQGQIGAAKAAYQRALELDADFVPAYVNLADLYASRGREDKALETLEKGIGRIPDSAALHHALGLSLVRAKRHNDALVALKKAIELTPTSARYYYVYAVALHSLGQKDQGITILKTANRAFPYDRDILSALVAFYRETGDSESLQTYINKLSALSE